MNTTTAEIQTLDATPTAKSAGRPRHCFVITYLTCSGKFKERRYTARDRFSAIRKAATAADYDMLVQCEKEEEK